MLRNKHFPKHNVKNSARPTCGPARAESQKRNPQTLYCAFVSPCASSTLDSASDVGGCSAMSLEPVTSFALIGGTIQSVLTEPSYIYCGWAAVGS